MAIIPTAIIPTKIASNLGFITFFNITIDGTDKAVTPIINVNTVPVPVPFNTNASAIGNVPNISAYIGIPTTAARIGANIFPSPKIVSMAVCGIQL